MTTNSGPNRNRWEWRLTRECPRVRVDEVSEDFASLSTSPGALGFATAPAPPGGGGGRIREQCEGEHHDQEKHYNGAYGKHAARERTVLKP